MGKHQYPCTRLDLETKLKAIVGRTLGEIDTAHVFKLTETNPKVTGIAGDVIEQSVIGYPPNSGQEPDLVVDGVEIELKTTGLKRASKGRGMEAKEPMSITAVSVDTIASEEFKSSNFWHKVEHLLIVYYLYDSDTTVKAADYALFPVKGYQFHEFDAEEIETLANDWQLIHDFITDIQTRYHDDESRKREYPRLSSSLRANLMLIDTAPKYPHPPRVRLKRSTVTTIARKNFGDTMEQLPKDYTTYAAIDAHCHKLAEEYSGRTVGDLAEEFGEPLTNKKTGRERKGIAEPLICKMFGGKARKMSSIELFSKIGLRGKSIVLTKSGTRTEDMKLITIDFDQFEAGSVFEESQIYEYFANNQLLCMVFEEPSANARLADNVFLGFKRIAFDTDFIEAETRRVWERIAYLIASRKLVDVVDRDKNGIPKVNKTGVIRSAPNFPKAKDGAVFVRGTGDDSTLKPEIVNGIRMYKQQLWIKGSYIAARLRGADWL